jgi:molybdate transport system ATP-binding protein
VSLEVDVRKTLKDFQLDVRLSGSGGRLGILGASGCGKSMTLKCIAGIVRPDSGRIVLNGRVLFDSSRKIDLPPQKRRVGYLFQNYALFPHLTVCDNIASGLGLSGAKARLSPSVREAVAMLRLEGLEDRYPGQLSGGQQQRAALARILAYRPEILLLDEPFSALDEFLREGLQLQLAEVLHSWGSDVILVTHSRDEVFKLCTRLAVMDGGGLIGMGETAALFAWPEKVQIARLTGCKNISPARKCGEFEVEAADWGLRLISSRPVPDDISAVGVRAHDFHPAGEGEVNSIAISVTDVSAGPFERSVIFQPERGSPLWWKFSRNTGDPELPGRLAVSPERVLLLKD